MSTTINTTAVQEPPQEKEDVTPALKKDFGFWMVFLSLCITVFLSALDLTSVSNTLPTIAEELRIDEFSWIGSA